MKRVMAIAAAFSALAIGASPARAQCASPDLHLGHAGHAGHGDAVAVEEHHEIRAWRSPGLAAALSLTPVPVDFGNFYAEHVAWGVAYTSLEVALMTPMMFLVADHGMGHSYYGTRNPWSDSERNWMIGLVTGYVVVKAVAGLHAARNAEEFNREHAPRISAAVVPTGNGALAMAGLRF